MLGEGYRYTEVQMHYHLSGFAYSLLPVGTGYDRISLLFGCRKDALMIVMTDCILVT